MADLADFTRLVPGDHGLCVVSTLRGDGTIQSSVVNAGVLAHPVTGGQVIGLVARGGSRKLGNLRARRAHPRRRAHLLPGEGHLTLRPARWAASSTTSWTSPACAPDRVTMRGCARPVVTGGAISTGRA